MNIFGRRSCIFGAAILLLGSGLSSLGQHSLPPGFPSKIQLGGVVQGDAAISALGNRLPEVAAFYRKSPGELRALFRSDHSLKADPQGQLFYVCDGLVATGSSASASVAESITPIDNPPFSTNQTFLLHSRRGANRVIYLDFNGHTDTSGKWKAGAAEPAFDLDGDTNSFNSTECNRIIYIWQRVSEDYSMYDIDVTTEDPGIEALRKSNSSDQIYGVRVVIGGSSYDWYGKGAGGVAFVGSFDDSTDTPCWVFPQQLGPNSEKYIAEAASHEAGHTLGLSHDGTTTGSAYYSGQGNWAPIMGVGYYKPIVQWSKGEYTNANQLQDDLAVMLNNGAVYRADDHGNSIAAATVLSTASTNGVIERNTDVDFFRFTAAGGLVAVTVARPPRDSNLHMQVILYDSNGVPILTNTPADSSTSGTQSSVNTLSLAAGNYYVSVAGVGNGNPLTTGYSDYASLGQYTVTVSGTAPTGPLWLPTVAGTYSWTNLPNWSGAPPNAVGVVALVNNNIAGNQTISLSTAITLGTLNLGDANDTHSFNLQPLGGSLTFNNGGSAAALNKTSGLDDLIAMPVTLASNLTIDHSAIGTLTFSGAIGGAGSLTKTGASTTILAGTNSYSGATTISDGVLRLDNTNALPAGNLAIDGGVLGLGSGYFTNRTVGTGAAQVRWTGDGGFAAYGAAQAVKFSASSINWSAANFIGNGNTLILGAEDADDTLIWQQAFSLAGGTRTIQVNDGPATIDAKLTGSIAGGSAGTYQNHFNKTGGGTLALTIQPTYYGDTTISGGTLMLGDGTGNSGGVSQNSSNVVISGGATLAVNRTGTLTQGGSALPVAIVGDGEFAQIGSGTTVFTLSNNYAGPTTISGGTLLVNNTNPNGSGTGTGAVLVNHGGTLGGTGWISGPVTINSGGTLSPGTSLGRLTLSGNLVLNAGSTNIFEVDGTTPTNDVVALGGTVTYGGVLKIISTGSFTSGQTFTLFSGAGAASASSFSSITGSPGNGQAFSFTNGVLSVVSVGTIPNVTTLTNSYDPATLTLTLSWPGGQNWRLEMQTNNLSTGLSTNWVDVTPGSASSTNIVVNPVRATVFYRLAHP